MQFLRTVTHVIPSVAEEFAPHKQSSHYPPPISQSHPAAKTKTRREYTRRASTFSRPTDPTPPLLPQLADNLHHPPLHFHIVGGAVNRLHLAVGRL